MTAILILAIAAMIGLVVSLAVTLDRTGDLLDDMPGAERF